LPDLESLRRDLTVLLGGLAAELVVGDGRVSPAGARDLVTATQHAFDLFVQGTHWPDDAPLVGRFRPLTGVLAVTILDRTFAEMERAVVAASRILVSRPAGPDTSDGSDNGA
jgi:hypothetical protein